jgi:hypothetical protein
MCPYEYNICFKSANIIQVCGLHLVIIWVFGADRAKIIIKMRYYFCGVFPEKAITNVSWKGRRERHRLSCGKPVKED